MKKLNELNRKFFKNDVLIILIIVSLPFLFFIYNLAPNDASFWKTYLFTMHSGIYEDIEFYLWSLSIRVLSIFLITVWYITCRHWWRYVLIIPLAIDLNNLLMVFNYRYEIFDNYLFLYSLPYILFYAVLIYLISIKLEYFPSNNSLSNQLNREISNMINNSLNVKKRDYKNLKLKLINLRKAKISMDKKEYLIKLIGLRDSVSIK